MRVTEEEMEASADRQDEWSIYFRWFAKKKQEREKEKKQPSVQYCPHPADNMSLMILQHRHFSKILVCRAQQAL